MADINSITLTGRLTKDPEIKYFESGSCKTTFSIANNKWSKKDEREIASFFNCEVWGKHGQYVAEYATKGSQIMLIGRLDTSTYTNDKGEKKIKVFIVADTVVLPKTSKAQEIREMPSDQEIANNEEIDEEIPF